MVDGTISRMALTVTNPNAQTPGEVWGRNRVVIKTVAFDSSYPTGGESLAASTLGMSELSIVLVAVNGSGYIVNYNHTTGKLMAFVEEAVAAGGPLLEVADTTDLSAVTVRILAIGI